jgi:hypothetical protein
VPVGESYGEVVGARSAKISYVSAMVIGSTVAKL